MNLSDAVTLYLSSNQEQLQETIRATNKLLSLSASNGEDKLEVKALPAKLARQLTDHYIAQGFTVESADTVSTTTSHSIIISGWASDLP